jgi:hypothetical protein
MVEGTNPVNRARFLPAELVRRGYVVSFTITAERAPIGEPDGRLA